MPTDAKVSNLRWPYGWSSSGGWLAMRTPIRATMFEAVSVREWKPSDRMLTAPETSPREILAAATTRFRKKTRQRTCETSR
jgi:hypothetical protein